MNSGEPKGKREKLPAPAFVMPAAVILQLAGVYWDVTWHLTHKFETFFSIPHAVLYIGVLAYLLAALKLRPSPVYALVGVGLEMVGGGYDLTYHSFIEHGFDRLLSPPHVVFYAGLLISAFAAAELVRQTRVAPLAYGAFTLTSFGIFWFVLSWQCGCILPGNKPLLRPQAGEAIILAGLVGVILARIRRKGRDQK